jgi:hypothetical protein
MYWFACSALKRQKGQNRRFCTLYLDYGQEGMRSNPSKFISCYVQWFGEAKYRVIRVLKKNIKELFFNSRVNLSINESKN